MASDEPSLCVWLGSVKSMWFSIVECLLHLVEGAMHMYSVVVWLCQYVYLKIFF